MPTPDRSIFRKVETAGHLFFSTRKSGHAAPPHVSASLGCDRWPRAPVFRRARVAIESSLLPFCRHLDCISATNLSANMARSVQAFGPCPFVATSYSIGYGSEEMWSVPGGVNHGTSLPAASGRTRAAGNRPPGLLRSDGFISRMRTERDLVLAIKAVCRCAAERRSPDGVGLAGWRH